MEWNESLENKNLKISWALPGPVLLNFVRKSVLEGLKGRFHGLTMEDLLLIVLRLDQERHAPTAHCDELLFILRVGQNLTELGLGHVGNLASLLHAHLNDQRQTVLTLLGLCGTS